MHTHKHTHTHIHTYTHTHIETHTHTHTRTHTHKKNTHIHTHIHTHAHYTHMLADGCPCKYCAHPLPAAGCVAPRLVPHRKVSTPAAFNIADICEQSSFQIPAIAAIVLPVMGLAG